MESIINVIKKYKNSFLLSGWICSIITFIAILQEGVIGVACLPFILIGTIPALLIVLVKIVAIDKERDWKNLIAALLGCVSIGLSMLLGVWFNI